MKKNSFFLVGVIALFFTGCATTDFSFAKLRKTEQVKVFKKGTVTKVQKVLVNDKEVKTITGLKTKKSEKESKGFEFSSVSDAVVGAIAGNEVKGYKISVIEFRSKKRYTAIVKQFVPLGTELEFVVENNEIADIDILALPEAKKQTIKKITTRDFSKKKKTRKVKKIVKSKHKQATKKVSKPKKDTNSQNFWG